MSAEEAIKIGAEIACMSDEGLDEIIERTNQQCLKDYGKTFDEIISEQDQ